MLMANSVSIRGAQGPPLSGTSAASVSHGTAAEDMQWPNEGVGIFNEAILSSQLDRQVR